MTYLLDANVVSELRKRRCDRHVAAWRRGVRPDEIHLSVLVLGEFVAASSDCVAVIRATLGGWSNGSTS